MGYSYAGIHKEELINWNYVETVRSDDAMLDARPSRYVKCRNIWKNPCAEKTNHALVMIAGDLMCQERFIEVGKSQANGNGYVFEPQLTNISEIINHADFAVGNLEADIHPEAPFSNEQLFIGKYYNRNAPAHFLKALKDCGFDMLTAANNHTLDTGLRGLYSTYMQLERFGFIHTGTYLDSDEKRWSLINVNGINVGIINYFIFSNFDMNESISKKAADITLDFYSIKRVKGAVNELRRYGADYIICCMHWGTELVHTASSWQKKRAQELADAGVDFIAGSHPHVLQPFDFITASDGRKVPVAYSIGNLVSHFEQNARKSSVILELGLTKDASGAVSCDIHYIPFYTFSEFNSCKYVTVPLINKKYSDNSINKTIKETKLFISRILSSKIKPSFKYNVQEDTSLVIPADEYDDVAYPYVLKEPTTFQRHLLEDFRYTEQYRDIYGNYMIDTHPNSESVKAALKNARKYLNNEKLRITDNRKLIADVVYTTNVLGFRGWEYFVYGFSDLSIAQRCEFLSQSQIDTIFNTLNDRAGMDILNDKMRAYEKYKPFYKRDIIMISSLGDLEAFSDFAKKHSRFIIKPLKGSTGTNVKLCDISDYGTPASFLDAHKEMFPAVCEELIINHPAMASIHPESVNSLRVFSYTNGVDAKVVCAWLKAGIGSQVIDNGSSGGILAAIDEKTGTVVSIARDEANRDFAAHPDTGFVFKGFQIPRWDECVEIVKKCALVQPNVRSVGWDVALSADKGWQIIEGNAHGMVSVIQVASRIGIRQKFYKSVEWYKYEK